MSTNYAFSFVVFVWAVTLSSSALLAQKEAPTKPAETGQPARELTITSGPTALNVSDTTAFITWSTNVSTNTALWYGVQPNKLDQVVRDPSDGLTHRMQLKNLRPNTTYYYRVLPLPPSATQAKPPSRPANFKTLAPGRKERDSSK